MAFSLRGLAALPVVLAAAAVTAGAGDVPRFASGTDLVTLSVTAVDKHGRPVTDLRREEMRVFEDGRPQKLEHFSHGRAVIRWRFAALRAPRMRLHSSCWHKRSAARH